MYKLHNPKGLTLLEVLLSIVILTIILVTVMKFFPQMGLMNKQNETKQQAVNLAKKELIYWQSTIEKINLDSPEQVLSLINQEKGDSIGDNTDTLTIKTVKTKSADSAFSVEVIINKDSDLLSQDSDILNPQTKAYLIHVRLFKAPNKLSSETYGYIFTKGEW